MSRSKLCALASGLVIAVGVAGCGGGDNSTTAAPTKDEFITQADAICKQGDEELQAAGRDLAAGGKPSDEEVNQFISDTLVPNLENQAEKLRALGAPEGDEAQVNAIVDGLDKAVEEVKADPTGLASGGVSFGEVNKLAQDYGLADCGNG